MGVIRALKRAAQTLIPIAAFFFTASPRPERAAFATCARKPPLQLALTWKPRTEAQLDALAELRRRSDPGYARLARTFAERHMPLAYRYALRFQRDGRPMDDLRQVAALGLTEAVHKWAPEANGQWALYAWHRCRYHLSRWVMQREPQSALSTSAILRRRKKFSRI